MDKTKVFKREECRFLAADVEGNLYVSVDEKAKPFHEYMREYLKQVVRAAGSKHERNYFDKTRSTALEFCDSTSHEIEQSAPDLVLLRAVLLILGMTLLPFLLRACYAFTFLSSPCPYSSNNHGDTLHCYPGADALWTIDWTVSFLAILAVAATNTVVQNIFATVGWSLVNPIGSVGLKSIRNHFQAGAPAPQWRNGATPSSNAQGTDDSYLGVMYPLMINMGMSLGWLFYEICAAGLERYLKKRELRARSPCRHTPSK